LATKEFGETLLDVAHQALFLKRSYFDQFGQKMWSSAALESWVQIELTMAFLTRNIPATVNRKEKSESTLTIDDHPVELRCATTPVPFWLIDAIKRHPKAEYYLFLTQTNPTLIADLSEYFADNDYSQTHKMVTDNWLIMVVKKKEITSLLPNSKRKDPRRLIHVRKTPNAPPLLAEKAPNLLEDKYLFYKKINLAKPELKDSFKKLKKIIDDLWQNSLRNEFTYENTIDFTTTQGTAVSIVLQPKQNRLMMYLKFKNQTPDDPKKKTTDVSRFGFGELNRRVYIEPNEDLGTLDQKGSVSNLLKQVHEINP
jgi:predicted transport protein